MQFDMKRYTPNGVRYPCEGGVPELPPLMDQTSLEYNADFLTELVNVMNERATETPNDSMDEHVDENRSFMMDAEDEF